MTHQSPLLEVFYRLRDRQFPLGAQEYLHALQALARGFGIGSRQRLIFLCQTLWAKSPEEQQQISDVFDAVLPPSLSDEELDDYLRDVAAEVERGQERSTDAAQTTRPQTGGVKKQREQPRQSLTGGAAAVQPHIKLNFTQLSSPQETHLPAPPLRNWPVSADWDFAGQLPVTKRHLKGAWRYLRLMQRTGQCTELDVPGTIEQTYRQGVLLEPALMPRRTNQARLLILTDEGGSMLPFRRQTQALLESAAQGGLRQVASYFFHDVPLFYLFNDPLMTQKYAERIEDVLENFPNVGVLILSDGGAARGNYDESRVSQTANFIGKLRHSRRNFAWLNPTPAERWAGTTAAKIGEVCRVRMMSYDRAGLDAAVGALRGKKH